ncbi:MAG: FAD-binding oxidoreductase [Candidatus Hodarchaeota archaeon]
MSRSSIAFNVNRIKRQLEVWLGEENVSTAEVDKICYSRDAWPLRLIRLGRLVIESEPDLIVWPQTVDQIQRIIQLANQERIPLIPVSGAGGVTGGTLPVSGGIVVDLKKMNRVLGLDEDSLMVTVEPGILGQELEEYLEARGYTTGHFPSSIFSSALGGFAAARSAGVLSSKYGKIEDMITGLEVVLPNGEILRTKAVPRSSMGPDLKQLFIGSEGVYGIITEITLRVAPIPQARRFASYLFPDLTSGMNAVKQIFRHDLQPALIRLYDENETRFVLSRFKSPPQSACVLNLMYSATKDLVRLEHRTVKRICVEAESEDLGPGPSKHWWDNRFDLYYPSNLNMGAGMLYDVLDVAASYANLEKMYWAMRESIEATGVSTMSHFSHFYPDGGNIYVIFIGQAGTPEEVEAKYNEVWQVGLDAAHQAGGTLSHQHGVGLLKAPWMPTEHGTTGLALLQAIKNYLDPNDIMNPGKLGLGCESKNRDKEAQ